MSLKKLSDQDLLNNVKNLVREERNLLAEVLRHLREIDSRRLYLSKGYSSLFSFCVEFLGYEESQAQRRISAARLIKEIPEIETQIERGSLSLTALTQAQSFFRQEASNDKPLNLSEKKALLSRLENQTTRQVEKTLARLNPSFISKKLESTKAVSETKSEIKVVVSNESLEKLNALKDILTQKNLQKGVPLTLAGVIDFLIEEGFAKHDPMAKAKRAEVKLTRKNEPPSAPKVMLEQSSH